MEDLQATTLTGAEALLGGAGVEEFKTNLRGRLLLAGDDGYDEARVIWNGMADKRPALIVRCSGVADAIDAVNFARTNNLRLAVRGGGQISPSPHRGSGPSCRSRSDQGRCN